MKEGTAENLRGQLESATFSHAINGLTSIGQAILEGQKRSEALQERIAVALETLARVKLLEARDLVRHPTDEEVLSYMKKYSSDMPTIREIAGVFGCSHSYILKSLPLSARYFRIHNGKGVKGKKMPVQVPGDDDGEYDK